MVRTRFLAISILVVAAVVRVWGIGYYPFKDECQLALSALLMDARGMVDPPVPNWPPLLYYVNLGGLRVAQLLGLMAPTEELLLALLRTGHIDVGPVHWLFRGIAAAIGTLTVALLFVLGRRLFGLATGAVAALLLAFAWLHVAYSHFPLTDGLTALVVLGSLALAVGAVDHGPRVRLRASMALAGVAVGAKYLGGIAALAPLGALVAIDRRTGRPWPATLVRAVSLGPFLLLGIWASMPGLPFHPDAYLAWLGRHASDMSAGWEGFETAARGWIYHL
jgi:4-amino-4-deoxy-L-arabinose transferase-like glycosyltransferase